MSAAWQLKLLFLEEKLQLGFHIDLNLLWFFKLLKLSALRLASWKVYDWQY